MIAACVDTFRGALALAGLALRSKLRFSGAYWQWREHTAFGRGTPAGAGFVDRIRYLAHYVRWVGQMRRQA
ncbi:MAG: hypothetical protein LW650_01270 [Planctomycetaceae bacterium]|jgi:hypothetical protein|nr:hypothetical protein [Phycisphaerales bacterium]MCE2652167.1 hypothetical protein [Planctomycetaceae bacterium]